MARGRYKLESVLNCLDTRLRSQRVCFHLRKLILTARGKTGRIESTFRELEDPDILTVRFVSIGFRHERRVNQCHGREIGKPIDLANRLGHRRAKKIDVMREDNHEIHFRRIGGRTDIREQLFPVLGDPFRLVGRQAVCRKVVLAGEVRA